MSDRKSAVGELWRETEAAKALLATYQNILTDDEDLRRDMVEGSTDLHSAVRAGVGRIAEIKAQRAGIKALMEGLKARDASLERQDESLRKALLVAMEAGALLRKETPFGVISRKAVAPIALITDESLLPAVYWRRADPTPDKKALLAALKELKPGESIPGATLSNGGATIQIR